MLDRCAVRGDSGTIRLTLWGDIIQQVTNHSCYSFENVLVKFYDFERYLTTTHSTRIMPTEERFPRINEQLFDSLFDVERISVEKISFAQQLKKWLSCCECGKHLTDVTSMPERIVKCDKCKTVQPVSSCSMKASARIAVRGSDHQLFGWRRSPQFLKKCWINQHLMSHFSLRKKRSTSNCLNSEILLLSMIKFQWW